MSSIFTSISKHLVTGNVPVTLGAAGDVFDSITFYGVKVDGSTNNAGNVTVGPINPISGVSAVTVAPGELETLLAPAGTTLTASQFEVSGANALDGVVARYFSAATVGWNKLESKIEEAAELLCRTVPKLVAECTISRGIDTDTRTANCIICMCDSAQIRPISQVPVGNYDCKLTIKVVSQADAYTGASSSFDPMAKHWERVAYVRDLFTDELAPTLLSQFVADLYLFEATRDVDARTTVEDRSYITELTMTVYAVGSDLT